MKMMTLEQIASACPDLKWKIERAKLFQYWGEYLSNYDPDNTDWRCAALSAATDTTAALNFIKQWHSATEQPVYICSLANDKNASG
jgi:hypothetical protein